MDTLVFDIETQNFFTDPGVGWDNFAALRISVVGVYSYDKDAYLVFEEGQMEDLAKIFKGASRIVGFASNRYDIPVLTHYFQKLGSRGANLWEKERIDLLEIIESATGRRISLSRLAETNLGTPKERQGSEAGVLYREGKMDELKQYCLMDVKLTKELYDIFCERSSFLIPDRETGEVKTVDFPRVPSPPSLL